MPHFRNFHGTSFSKNSIDDLGIDQETITASNRFDDLGIDQETITASNRFDDLGIDQETITADKGDDMIVSKLGIYDLVDKFDFGDVAPVRSETVNVSQSDDQLFDPNDFGETPPLDLSYELHEVGGFGETPPEDIAYTLDFNQ